MRKFIVGMALAASCAALARADETPGKNWKNTTEVSVVSANGNSKSTTASGKNKFSYQWSKAALELEGGALSASNQGATTAEQYYASEKVDYKLSDRNYTFEKYRWDKDRFAGIHSRHDSQLGLGRELIASENDKLTLELGGGYVIEERIDTPVNKFASGRAYSKYTHKISGTSQFSQDAEFLENFKDKNDFRVNTESALTAALSVHFSLKTAFVWKYVGVPPAGFGRSDTALTMALIASY